MKILRDARYLELIVAETAFTRMCERLATSEVENHRLRAQNAKLTEERDATIRQNDALARHNARLHQELHPAPRHLRAEGKS
jgi:FtsZ-binding cell division protein ZapB